MSLVGYCLVILHCFVLISFSVGNNFYCVSFQISIFASHEVISLLSNVLWGNFSKQIFFLCFMQVRLLKVVKVKQTTDLYDL